MRRTVIYDGGTFEITARELLFSVIIVILMLTAGFFIGEKIASAADERNQEYEQAAKIDGDKELFEYGMRTDIGNAFVSGTLRAVDPVSLPEIDGEYAYIKKVEERYTKHTRTVTDYDEDGNVCGSHEETYYTWDAVGHEDYACSQITFLDHAFEYGTIDFPSAKYLKTIKESSKLRYAYYVTEKEYDGTIYAKLADKTISDVTFIEGKGVNDAVEYMCNSSAVGVLVFWIFWIVLICAAVYGFCYLDNRWVED